MVEMWLIFRAIRGGTATRREMKKRQRGRSDRGERVQVGHACAGAVGVAA